MGKSGILGSFEEMVLLAVLHGGSTAYAGSVRRELSERMGAEIAMGSVYATLDRIEDKGLVGSHLEKPDGRTGRPRRFYRVLPAGLGALEQSRRIREAMWRGLPATRREGGGA